MTTMHIRYLHKDAESIRWKRREKLSKFLFVNIQEGEKTRSGDTAHRKLQARGRI